MKRTRSRSSVRNFITGSLLFVLTTAVMVTVTVLLFDLVNRRSGGNVGYIAATMLGCVLVTSAVEIIIDFFRRKIMIDRPVSQIVEGTERIIGGDFSVEFVPRHAWGKFDEYDVIMDNLNRVTKELSETEILRNDFVANVSHEIKTPLSIIQNAAVALKNGKMKPTDREELIETLLTAAKRLNALVGNILKLSKLENQAIFATQTEVNISASLSESILTFEELLDAKKINLTCDIEDDVKLMTDASFLEIVWSNLLSNAIKFTAEGGTINVSLFTENGAAVVKVSDSGIGMTAETGNRIFDKFYQGDASRAQEGNGLGLALVKRVIDLVGGEISVESAVGLGTTFTIKLRTVS